MSILVNPVDEHALNQAVVLDKFPILNTRFQLSQSRLPWKKKMEEYNVSVKKYNYRELQAIAKKLGLPGNLKHHLLFEVIKARECGNENVVQKILSEQKLERARRKSEKLEGKDAGYKHLNIFQEKKRGPRTRLIKEPEKPQQFHHYETPKAPKKPYSGPDSYLRSLLALPHHSLRELVIKNHQESVLRAKKMRMQNPPLYQIDNTGAHCSTQVITEYQNPYNMDNTIQYSTNYSNDGNARSTGIENLQSTDCNELQPRTDVQDPFMQFYPSYVTTTTTNENIIPTFIPDVQPQPEYSFVYPTNQIQYTPYYQENSYPHNNLKEDNNNIQCIQNNSMYRIGQNISPTNSDTMSASEPDNEQIFTNHNQMHYMYQNQNQVENVRNNEMQISHPSHNYQVTDNQLITNQPPQDSQIVFESEVQDYTFELQRFTPILPDPLYLPNINNLSNNKDVDIYEEISSEDKYLDLAQEIEISTCTSDKEEASEEFNLIPTIL